MAFSSTMAVRKTDLTKTLEQLTGLDVGDPDEAPTPMIEDLLRSWKKPLSELSNEEIGDLVIQHDGYPFVLDLVWRKLEADPLFDGGHYPGDVLSILIRAEPEVWLQRPEYQTALEGLYRRALDGPPDDVWGFRNSLGLPEVGKRAN